MPWKYLDEFPTFEFGVWPAFDDLNAIIFLSLPLLVMNVTDGPLADDLAVQRMSHLTWNLNPKSLGRFGTRDDTDQFLLQRLALINSGNRVPEGSSESGQCPVAGFRDWVLCRPVLLMPAQSDPATLSVLPPARAGAVQKSFLLTGLPWPFDFTCAGLN